MVWFGWCCVENVDILVEDEIWRCGFVGDVLWLHGDGVSMEVVLCR